MFLPTNNTKAFSEPSCLLIIFFFHYAACFAYLFCKFFFLGALFTLPTLPILQSYSSSNFLMLRQGMLTFDSAWPTEPATNITVSCQLKFLPASLLFPWWNKRRQMFATHPSVCFVCMVPIKASDTLPGIVHLGCFAQACKKAVKLWLSSKGGKKDVKSCNLGSDIHCEWNYCSWETEAQKMTRIPLSYKLPVVAASDWWWWTLWWWCLIAVRSFNSCIDGA